MNDAEKLVVKTLLKELVDVELPALVAAEEQRLPIAYQPLVKAVVDALMPKLVALLDEKIMAM